MIGSVLELDLRTARTIELQNYPSLCYLKYKKVNEKHNGFAVELFKSQLVSPLVLITRS
jgi:hypothetical protein